MPKIPVTSHLEKPVSRRIEVNVGKLRMLNFDGCWIAVCYRNDCEGWEEERGKERRRNRRGGGA